MQRVNILSGTIDSCKNVTQIVQTDKPLRPLTNSCIDIHCDFGLVERLISAKHKGPASANLPVSKR